MEVANRNISVIECERGLLGISALPDLLILVSYIWALILFRFIEPENLSTLIETVRKSNSGSFLHGEIYALLVIVNGEG